MDTKLTKEADKTLCEIYEVYLNRRSDGMSKRAAKDFADKDTWPDPDWQTPNGVESLSELRNANMIKMFILGGFEMTDNAIIYMENRFKNGLSEVLEYIEKIKSILHP